MFGVFGQLVSNVEMFFYRNADSVQPAVSVCGYSIVCSVVGGNRNRRFDSVVLPEMTFGNMEGACDIAVGLFENIVNPFGIQLAVLFIGHVFDEIAEFLFHLIRQHNAVRLF